ncbi:hypothetical protein BMI91_19675 [Thioclava sediminum]|uniref:RNA polymerase sigma-70 region 2 domain-containing protein n=1 Tax=Thioclava sediminum TaxID=1915319 RepID=A0ABX3MWH8_9RHOB|nr:sigma factor [Thioclava sediminum]OOY22504.1 hypothetical protein BMI91_19675 [Thioclava sediminum]
MGAKFDYKGFQDAWVKAYREDGDENAFKLLLDSVEPIIRGEVRHAAKIHPHIDRDDLYSEGVVGVMNALERFDLSNEASFGTYARFWIRERVLMFVHMNKSATSAKTGAKERSANLRAHALVSSYEHAGMSNSKAIEQTAGELDTTVQHVSSILVRDAGIDVASADDYGLLVVGGCADDSMSTISREELAELIENAIQGLARGRASEKRKQFARDVMSRAFADEEKVVLSTIGNELGVTGQTIRNCIRDVTELARRDLESRGLSLDDLL